MADEAIKRLIELSMNASPAIAEAAKLQKAMEQNTESVDGLANGIRSMAENATRLFQGLAVADLAKEFVSGVRSMIDEMDELGKAAQLAGLSVEKLQEVQYALQLGAGLDSGQATAALTRFAQQIADVGNKTSDSARILRELGVTIDDDVGTALEKLAEAFAKAPDGVNKLAVATEIFGRSLAIKMLPFLNEGVEGIADMRKELHELGGVIEDETTKQADQFNDNLEKLAKSSRTLGVAITKDLLPPLVDFTNALVESIKQGNLWDSLMQRMSQNNADRWTLLKRGLGLGDGEQTNQEMREQTQRLSEYSAKMKEYADQVARMKSTDNLPQATLPRERKGAKSPKEQLSELEQWWKALLKAQQAIDDTPAKIAKLEGALSDLAAKGDTSSDWVKRLQAELLKLRPDPVISAINKLAEAAKKLDERPALIEGLTKELERLQEVGPQATAEVALLHKEILKLKGEAGDSFALVTTELEKMREATRSNIEQEQIWWDLLAQGKVTTDEWLSGVKDKLPEVRAAIKDTTKDMFDLGKAISDASAKFVTDFVDDLIEGFGKTKASFADTIEDMVKQLAKLLVQMQIAKAFADSAKGGGGLGSIFAGLFTGGAAQGAAFASPDVQYMAQGGILNSPTFFSHAGRFAVAGEAGPEAVVPLKRTGGGDLGVSASPVTVNVNNHTSAEVATTSKDNADGSRQIDIYITQKVKQVMADGTMDRTMRSTYGVARRPAAGT